MVSMRVERHAERRKRAEIFSAFPRLRVRLANMQDPLLPRVRMGGRLSEPLGEAVDWNDFTKRIGTCTDMDGFFILLRAFCC